MPTDSEILIAIAAEPLQNCKSGGEDCEICATQQATLRKYAAIARALESDENLAWWLYDAACSRCGGLADSHGAKLLRLHDALTGKAAPQFQEDGNG